MRKKYENNKEARLNENSPLISIENKEILLQEWGQYWDNEKTILVEKSPPNLIRTRFLQALFPEALFITIIRHPIAVCLATHNWNDSMRKRTSINELIKHWIEAYDIYENDRKKLNNELYFTYEYMVQHPEEIINVLENYIGAKIKYKEKIVNRNEYYFNNWKKKNWIFNLKKRNWIKKYEKDINRFGYSFIDLEMRPKNILSNRKSK